MRYVQFGRTGARVSEVAYGTDNLGNPYGADEETSRQILGTVLDAGINHIDTADSYADGNSEKVIGKYLEDSGRRNEVFLTTKVRSRVGDGPNDVGASRYHILNGIDESLRRLRTDHVDLYLIHSFDRTTPVEETVRALDDVVRAGKAHYVGCSNWAAWQLAQALWISDVNNLARFECIQSEFNIVRPGLAVETIPLCIQEKVAVTAYSPMGSGFLTGKHSPSGAEPETKFGTRDAERGGSLKRKYFDEYRFEVVEKLRSLSDESGQPMIRLALQWVRETPGVTSPIIGARRVDQIESTLDALSEDAPEDVMSMVREIAEEFAASTPVTYPPPVQAVQISTG
ncbi:MAG: aldo/keto reductase [Chloroflexi bacterium]|nr:aldo/keto reductase [Chloroflexota bacterium]